MQFQHGPSNVTLHSLTSRGRFARSTSPTTNHGVKCNLLPHPPLLFVRKVYRADIDLWKDNMWGLLGLKLCLEAGRTRCGYVEALMNLKAWQLWDKNTTTGEITPADDNSSRSIDFNPSWPSWIVQIMEDAFEGLPFQSPSWLNAISSLRVSGPGALPPVGFRSVFVS